MLRLRQVDRAVLATARDMEQRALIVGTTGNVSARVAGGAIRITPTRVDYRRARRRDLVTVALDGSVVPGRRVPSRELPLHLAVYCARPDVGAVVHTHSPYATAWGITGRTLDPGLEDQEYYGLGAIGCVPAAPAGSAQLACAAASALASENAALLARHGVLAVGPDPAAALLNARVIEHLAHVAHLAGQNEWLVEPGFELTRPRPPGDAPRAGRA